MDQQTICKVSVVMPAFNESEGIVSFLQEIFDSLENSSVLNFIVVDDYSEDETSEKVLDWAAAGNPVKLIRNEMNLGHGPSTLLAMKAGVSSGSNYVITVDGDGQFLGSDIEKLLNFMVTENSDLVEGVRSGRTDPLYRRIVSLMTRILVLTKSGKSTNDANTPLRIYNAQVLEKLVQNIPNDSLVPNLLISVLTRKNKYSISQVKVRSIDRRGSDKEGSTWKTKFKNLPSKRFRKFVYTATLQFVRFNPKVWI